MRYKTYIPEMHDQTIPGMHGETCLSLIKKTLETKFENIDINLETKIVKFDGDDNSEITEHGLDDLFKSELNKHGFTYMMFSLDEESQENK